MKISAAKQRKRVEPLHESLQRATQLELLEAAGAGPSVSGDPLADVTQHFHRSFDLIGQRQAAEMAERDRKSEGEEQDRQQPKGPEQTGPEEKKPEADDSDLVARFSSMAFRKGTLSGAILNGSGKMMLMTCLKRCGDRVSSRNPFSPDAKTENIKGYRNDQTVYWKNAAQKAVGLVVDTTQDAKRTVDELVSAAESGKLPEGSKGQVLRQTYPFLEDSREKEYLALYKEQLAQAQNPEERSVLNNAVLHAQALIERKAQMRMEFISQLRWISDRAQDALKELSDSDWLFELSQQVMELDEDDDGTDGTEGKPSPGGGGTGGPTAGPGAKPDSDGDERNDPEPADQRGNGPMEPGGPAPDGTGQ